jgi:hypothetical protein
MTKKKVLITIIILLLIGLAILAILYFKNQKDNNSKKSVKTVEIIDGYGYSIKDNDSKLKREKFKELKEILNEEPIDNEKYALKIAEIFAIDVYDLVTKNSKYDVGGLDYVLPESKDNLKLILQDTLYSNLQDNFDKDRKQKLPEVTNATSSILKRKTYALNKKNYDGYELKVIIDYKEDLGYDNTIVVTVIEKEDKLFVVAVQPM